MKRRLLLHKTVFERKTDSIHIDFGFLEKNNDGYPLCSRRRFDVIGSVINKFDSLSMFAGID